MSTGFRKTLKALDWFGRTVENALLVVLFVFIMLLPIWQIADREIPSVSQFVFWPLYKTLGSPLGVEELIRLIVFWLAMIAAIAAARDDRHIRIDALSHVLPERAVDVTRILVDVFAAIVCGVVAWFAYQYVKAESGWGTDVLAGTVLSTPAWVAHVIFPIAFVLISYRFLILAITKLFEMFRSEPAEAAE